MLKESNSFVPKAGPAAWTGRPALLLPALLSDVWRFMNADDWKRAAIGSKSADSAETLRGETSGSETGLPQVVVDDDVNVSSGGVHWSSVGEPTGGGGNSELMNVLTRFCRSTTYLRINRGQRAKSWI